MRSLFPKRGTTAYELLKTLMQSEEERVCSQDPELWWMTDNRSINEAKAICKNTDGIGTPCPLLMVCAEYAITSTEPNGVWGGLGPEDRLVIRRRRTKAKARTAARAARLAGVPVTATEEEEAS